MRRRKESELREHREIEVQQWEMSDSTHTQTLTHIYMYTHTNSQTHKHTAQHHATTRTLVECGLVAPGPVSYQGHGHHPALRGRVDEGVSLESFRGPNALWGEEG